MRLFTRRTQRQWQHTISSGTDADSAAVETPAETLDSVRAIASASVAADSWGMHDSKWGDTDAFSSQQAPLQHEKKASSDADAGVATVEGTAAIAFPPHDGTRALDDSHGTTRQKAQPNHAQLAPHQPVALDSCIGASAAGGAAVGSADAWGMATAKSDAWAGESAVDAGMTVEEELEALQLKAALKSKSILAAPPPAKKKKNKKGTVTGKQGGGLGPLNVAASDFVPVLAAVFNAQVSLYTHTHSHICIYTFTHRHTLLSLCPPLSLSLTHTHTLTFKMAASDFVPLLAAEFDAQVSRAVEWVGGLAHVCLFVCGAACGCVCVCVCVFV